MSAEKMLEYLYNLPDQFRFGLEFPLDIEARYRKSYRNILITGLGGSAMGGDFLRTYAANQALAPIIVNRDYNIPAFVNNDTLVLAVSYSGNTEETISAFRQAGDRLADRIVFTSGGVLDELARREGCAVFNVPAGYVPRAAAGVLFAPVVLLLEKLGIVTGARDELIETHNVLQTMRSELLQETDDTFNIAKDIADRIAGTIPVIWGACGVTEAVAMRWKAQINENAKSLAYYNVLPELNHNEIVGFEAPNNLVNRISVIILQDRYAGERLRRRIEVSKSIIKDKAAQVIEVESRGDSFLSRLFSLVYIGDVFSYYLALAYNINPTPVEVIDYLKNELAR